MIYIALALIGISSLLGLISYKKLGVVFRILTISLLLTFITQTLAIYVAFEFHSNYRIIQIYTIIMIPLYYLIYREIFKNSKYSLLILIVYITLFVVSQSITIFIRGFDSFPQTTIFLTSLVVVFCTLLYYRQMLNQPIDVPIGYQSIFWLNTAFFFFHSASFCIWSVNYFAWRADIAVLLITVVNNIVNLIYYPILILALIFEIKQKTFWKIPVK